MQTLTQALLPRDSRGSESPPSQDPSPWKPGPGHCSRVGAAGLRGNFHGTPQCAPGRCRDLGDAANPWAAVNRSRGYSCTLLLRPELTSEPVLLSSQPRLPRAPRNCPVQVPCPHLTDLWRSLLPGWPHPPSSHPPATPLRGECTARGLLKPSVHTDHPGCHLRPEGRASTSRHSPWWDTPIPVALPPLPAFPQTSGTSTSTAGLLVLHFPHLFTSKPLPHTPHSSRGPWAPDHTVPPIPQQLDITLLVTFSRL